jgi:hypothetical protein
MDKNKEHLKNKKFQYDFGERNILGEKLNLKCLKGLKMFTLMDS